MELKPLKPLSGFIELLPKEQQFFDDIALKMQYLLKKFGFLHVDLPSIERAEVLCDKDNFDEIETQMFLFQKADTKMGLRYDGTVGLSRYISKNISDLVFPSRFYQFAKNYRGERPKRGRYREFYQLDFDILGIETLSSYYDAEVISVALNLCNVVKHIVGNIIIKISDRNFWNVFCDYLNINIAKRKDLFILIDKKDKISSFNDDLINLIGKKEANLINKLFLDGYKSFKNLSQKLDVAIDELSNFEKILNSFNIKDYIIDLSVMRGHAYYTGIVFEIFCEKYLHFGAIAGGGRYENLTSKFSKTKIIGVGGAIGFSRLIMNIIEENLITKLNDSLVVLLIMDKNCVNYSLDLLDDLRKNNINVVPYLDIDKKFKNKIEFADKVNSSYCIIIGEDEVKNNKVSLKNMQTGCQKILDKEQLIGQLWKKN